MHDLRIRITESDGIESVGLTIGHKMETVYRTPNHVGHALAAILEGLESFRDIPRMVDALHFCPEFCQLAAAVHGLHLAESDETPTTEAIGILTRLRDSRQPEVIRTRAGNLLIDIAEDDRAVCDASSVDAVDPIRDNIAGTRVRYIGEVELIKGKCGVLTGTKRTPEEICVECVEVKIDGLTWAIPCEFPQFTVCDASSVDERPGQDAGAALVGVECYVWDGEWEEEFEAVPLKILSITENRYSAQWPGYPQDQSWAHARPVYLGLPEATP